MYNRVVLAEKPDMGRNIAEALGVAKSNRGYIELKNGDVVTWAIGHIIRLKTPDMYPEYKEWRMETLPIIPDQMLTEIDPDKKEQFKIIKALLSKSESCVIATDPGREGEHIGRTIIDACGFKGKLLRLWIDDLTPATIRTGFQQLKDGKDTFHLAESAKVRAYADYWMGFTATRFFTLVAQEVTKENTLLSAGRVQTPTLRIVYDREIAMEQFTPQPFYVLMTHFATDNGIYKAQWFKQLDDRMVYRFNKKEEAEEVRKKIEGQAGTVTRYEEKQVKRHAPRLLHSTSIKTAARKELGFSIEKTVKILQSIYDKGFVTYPRTSSRHLSENAADKLAVDLIAIREVSAYKQLFPEDIQSLKGKSRFVDNKKAAEHHAIVPTGQPPTGLSDDEEKLYALILRYTLAAHHPEGLDKEILAVTTVAGENFYTKAIVTLEEGWRKIVKFDAKEEETEDELSVSNAKLPQLQQGDKSKVQKSDTLTGKTSPPKRLAGDELEKAMEHAGRIVEDTAEDDEVLQQLKEKGIGTPATRTAIIQELANREYIEIKKNLVYLTDKGRNFMELIYNHPLASIELTGEFEKKLAEVAEGKRSSAETLTEYKQFVQDILTTKEELKQHIQNRLKDKPLFQNINEVGTCPNCGKPVIEGAKGYGCSGWKEGCKFVIWKEFRKVKLKDRQVKDLLAGKEVLLNDIPPKEAGRSPYSVFVFLKNGSLETRFPTNEDRSIGECPLCRKPVVERETFYGCSGWKEGCSFRLNKEFLNKQISVSQMKKLLKTGRTDKIVGFVSSKGNKFDAVLGYDKSLNRYSFLK